MQLCVCKSVSSFFWCNCVFAKAYLAFWGVIISRAKSRWTFFKELQPQNLWYFASILGLGQKKRTAPHLGRRSLRLSKQLNKIILKNQIVFGHSFYFAKVLCVSRVSKIRIPNTIAKELFNDWIKKGDKSPVLFNKIVPIWYFWNRTLYQKAGFTSLLAMKTSYASWNALGSRSEAVSLLGSRLCPAQHELLIVNISGFCHIDHDFDIVECLLMFIWANRIG